MQAQLEVVEVIVIVMMKITQTNQIIGLKKVAKVTEHCEMQPKQEQQIVAKKKIEIQMANTSRRKKSISVNQKNQKNQKNRKNRKNHPNRQIQRIKKTKDHTKDTKNTKPTKATEDKTLQNKILVV